MQQPLCNRKTLNEIELEIGNSRLDSLAWLLRFFLSPSFRFPVNFSIYHCVNKWERRARLIFPMTRHKTPFSVAPPPAAKTAANFQLFGFSMMKIDHHHPSLPPRISMHSIKSGWKMEKRRRWTSAGKLSEIQFGERRHFDLSTPTRTSLVFFFRQNRECCLLSIFL